MKGSMQPSFVAAREYMSQLEKPEKGLCLLLFWVHRALLLGQLCAVSRDAEASNEGMETLLNIVEQEGATFFDLSHEDTIKLYNGMMKIMALGTEETRTLLKEGPPK